MSNARRLRLRKEKQRMRRNQLLVILTVILALFCITAYAWGDNKSVTYKEVVVSQGDTLWSIAGRYTDTSKDIRKTVYEIKSMNAGAENTLYPGDVLLVPIYN